MNNLTIAQKAYLAVLLAVGGSWLALALGIPVYEYLYGKSALTALLARIAEVLIFAFFVIAALAWVLQRVGILPIVRPDPTLENTIGQAFNPIKSLRNLVIWIVVALLLVFFYNLFQGTGNHNGNSVSRPVQSPDLTQAHNPDLMSLFINWFPMLIIFGVWIVFLRKMQIKAGQEKDTDKPNRS